MQTIYQIRCRVNNKVYIGKTTKTVDCRWKQHLNGDGHAPFLYRAIKKYGPENFDVWVLYPDAVTAGHLNMLEEMFIKQCRSNDRRYGYNLTSGGEGARHTLETRRKLSRMLKGKPSRHLGYKHSEETKRKMSRRRRQYWENKKLLRK